MINAEVQKSGTESTMSVMRKFSRKVQSTGLIQTVRKGRYYVRRKSATVAKKGALKRIARHENRLQLIKEGKLVEDTRKGRRPQHSNQSSAQATASQQSTSSPARSSGLGESTPIAR